MPVEFNSVLNEISNSIYSTPIFNKILSNIFYTSIILSILLLIVFTCMFPSKESAPEWAFVKVFIYLTLVNCIVLGSYQSTISNKYKEKYSDNFSKEFINKVNSKTGGAIYNADSIKVVPNFSQMTPEQESDDIMTDGGNIQSNTQSMQSVMHNNSANTGGNIQLQKNVSVSHLLDDVERRLQN